MYSYNSGPCQSSHSRVRVPQKSQPYFTVCFETPSTWRIRSPYLNPPGTGWSVIPPGTGFPFRRLLRLAVLRWRYSNPPPLGQTNLLLRQVSFFILTSPLKKFKFSHDRWSVGQCVLVSGSHLEPMTRSLFSV
jgi:hypothetical protein